jgi:hypothetical protein
MMTDKTKFKHAHLTGQTMRDHWGPIVDRIAADSLSQHCPNCEAQAAEIERLRMHLDVALETLAEEGVCGDECNSCKEARAALGETK